MGEAIKTERLSNREQLLVGLGAALGANCIPCIEYHIPEARKAGITDEEIDWALRVADKIRKVPARRVLDVALARLAGEETEIASEKAPGGCCGG
jgi:4-carboxymuconolactone decarboxylase